MLCLAQRLGCALLLLPAVFKEPCTFWCAVNKVSTIMYCLQLSSFYTYATLIFLMLCSVIAVFNHYTVSQKSSHKKVT